MAEAQQYQLQQQQSSADVSTVAVVNESNTVGVELLPLQFKLPDSTSSNSDTDGETADNAAGEGEAAVDSVGRAGSPPPNCAICLGRCKNKCFTDSCIHQFCFKCLCEWSKVKAECPLCKQNFKSIIHNVKSSDQFERYHVQPPTVQIPHRPIVEGAFEQPPYADSAMVNPRNDYEISVANWNSARAPDRIVRARRAFFSAITGGAGASGSAVGRNRFVGAEGGENAEDALFHSYELLDMYHREYPDAVSSNEAASQRWRRYVYDRKFYALPVLDITGRYRDTSARFYRNNPAQIHRLMPFITRDITCLLRNTEHDLTLVLERIKDNLSISNILSPTFRRQLQPFLGSRTAHFIHELHNFARSPYDMIGYDRSVQYSTQITDEIVIEFSSSTSSDEENSNAMDIDGESRARDPHLARSINDYRVQSRTGNSGTVAQPSLVNLLSFTISTTSEGVEAPGVTVAVSGRGTQSTAINLTTHNRANDVIIDLDETDRDVTEPAENATTSASATASASNTLNVTTQAATSTITENIELTSSSSDECEFVLERKPPHLRTPEMVSLNSESDSDVVFVTETKIQKYAFGSTDDENTVAGPNTENVQPTNEANNSLANVKNERSDRELYNVGPSTSTNLQNTRRKTRETSQKQLRRKHSRGNGGGGDVRRKSKRHYNTFLPSSCSSTSPSDSDSDYEYKKPCTRARVQRKDRRTAKSNKRESRTTQSTQNNKGSSKRCKLSTRDVPSDTSEEDERLSLKMLKYRLAQANGKSASDEVETTASPMALEEHEQRTDQIIVENPNISHNFMSSGEDADLHNDDIKDDTTSHDDQYQQELKPICSKDFLTSITSHEAHSEEATTSTAIKSSGYHTSPPDDQYLPDEKQLTTDNLIDAILSQKAPSEEATTSNVTKTQDAHTSPTDGRYSLEEKPVTSQSLIDAILSQRGNSEEPTTSTAAKIVVAHRTTPQYVSERSERSERSEHSVPPSRTNSIDSMSSATSSSSTSTSGTTDNSHVTSSSEDSDTNENTNTNTTNTDATVGANPFIKLAHMFSTDAPDQMSWTQDSLPSQSDVFGIVPDTEATSAAVEAALQSTHTGLDLSTYPSLDMLIYSDEEASSSEAMTEQQNQL